MTSPAQLAQVVAEALGLEQDAANSNFYETHVADASFRVLLLRDGSNLFDPYWFLRCLLWLQERGWITFGCGVEMCAGYKANLFRSHAEANPMQIDITCRAEEFPARAIFAIRGGE